MLTALTTSMKRAVEVMGVTLHIWETELSEKGRDAYIDELKAARTKVSEAFQEFGRLDSRYGEIHKDIQSILGGHGPITGPLFERVNLLIVEISKLPERPSKDLASLVKKDFEATYPVVRKFDEWRIDARR